MELRDVCKSAPVKIHVASEGNYCLDCYNDRVLSRFGKEDTFDYPRRITVMESNGKSEFSKIESIILNASQCYDIPEGTPFTSVNAEDREKIIKQTTK